MLQTQLPRIVASAKIVSMSVLCLRSGCTRQGKRVTQSAHKSTPHQRTRRDHSTETAEDYVEAVAEIIAERVSCRLVDLAEYFGVSHVTAPLKKSVVAVVSARGRALLCQAEEVAQLAGPGRGVIVLKLDQNDTVVGFALLSSKEDELVLLKEDGGTLPVSLRKYQVVGRGGKGHPLFKRGRLTGMVPAEWTVPILQTEVIP